MEEIEFYNDLKQWSGICFCSELNLENLSDLWEQSSAVDATYSTVDRKSRDGLLSSFWNKAAGACSVFVLLSISSHKVAKAVPRINIENLNQLNWNSSELPLCYLDTTSVERSEKTYLELNTTQMKSVLLKWIESWMLGHQDIEGARQTRKGYWQPQCFYC